MKKNQPLLVFCMNVIISSAQIIADFYIKLLPKECSTPPHGVFHRPILLFLILCFPGTLEMKTSTSRNQFSFFITSARVYDVTLEFWYREYRATSTKLLPMAGIVETPAADFTGSLTYRFWAHWQLILPMPSSSAASNLCDIWRWTTSTYRNPITYFITIPGVTRLFWPFTTQPMGATDTRTRSNYIQVMTQCKLQPVQQPTPTNPPITINFNDLTTFLLLLYWLELETLVMESTSTPSKPFSHLYLYWFFQCQLKSKWFRWML